jgi:hypothetical protein
MNLSSSTTPSWLFRQKYLTTILFSCLASSNRGIKGHFSQRKMSHVCSVLCEMTETVSESSIVEIYI